MAVISANKPVTATSTCGADGPETFCGYSNPMEDCSIVTCDDSCPFSNSSPTPVNLVEIGELGSGVVVSDSVAGPGFTGMIADFINDTSVRISAADVPQISNEGFTFASWIKQSSDTNGYIICRHTT